MIPFASCSRSALYTTGVGKFYIIFFETLSWANWTFDYVSNLVVPNGAIYTRWGFFLHPWIIVNMRMTNFPLFNFQNKVFHCLPGHEPSSHTWNFIWRPTGPYMFGPCWWYWFRAKYSSYCSYTYTSWWACLALYLYLMMSLAKLVKTVVLALIPKQLLANFCSNHIYHICLWDFKGTFSFFE